MIRRFFRLVLLCVVVVVLIILFAPSLIQGAGNALLSSVNNSAAQGIAQFIPHAQGNGADLQVKLDGLIANSAYYISVDQGRCGGPALFRVGKVVTDGNGSATTTLSLNGLQSALQQNLWLDVHRGTDTSGQSVACGQLLSTESVLAQYGVVPTVTTKSSSPSANSTGVPTGVSNTNSPTPNTNSSADNGPLYTHIPGGLHVTDFPDTGVAPAKSNSYDNYRFPRKY